MGLIFYLLQLPIHFHLLLLHFLNFNHQEHKGSIIRVKLPILKVPLCSSSFFFHELFRKIHHNLYLHIQLCPRYNKFNPPFRKVIIVIHQIALVDLKYFNQLNY